MNMAMFSFDRPKGGGGGGSQQTQQVSLLRSVALTLMVMPIGGSSTLNERACPGLWL